MADAKSKRYEIVSNDGNEAVIHFFDSHVTRTYKVVDLDSIEAKIQNGEEINLNGCYIKDFIYKQISEDTDKPLVKFSARNSFWDGKVDLSGAHFGDDDVFFSRAHFGDGEVDFWGAEFGDGNVYFGGAHFGDGDVDFRYARFGNGKVDFSYVKFGDGGVFFNDANFGDGNVDFLHAKFGNGDVDFSNVHFGNANVDFGYTEFGNGECHFENITAGETTINFIKLIIHSHITLSFKAVKKLVFENCTCHDVIEFQEAIDKKTYTLIHNAIKELAFLNFCNLGTIRLNWNKFKKALMAYKGDSERITDEFKMLKENYHNQGEYDWEDAAYVEFKNRYREGIEVPPFVPPFKEGFWKALEGFWKVLKVWCRKALLKLLYKVGRYGTDYTSIAKTMVGVWFFWGILYALPFASIYPPKPDGSIDCHWWSPFYYSAITFFTVGYGDLSAQNFCAAALCVAESFLGVFLMSYFSVAVVRKILR